MKYVVAEETLVVEGSETAPEEQKRNFRSFYCRAEARVKREIVLYAYVATEY